MGAYLSLFAPSVPTYLYATLLAGQYTTPAIYCNVKAVFTHTVPVDAYRGAGRPEATYLVERIVENAAREMGIDKAEIRRRNFIKAEQMPYATPVALPLQEAKGFAFSADDVLARITPNTRLLIVNSPANPTGAVQSVEDVRRAPFEGIGKPEPLKGDLSGWWSRRIDGEHRLVYRVVESGGAPRVQVAQCRYHY